MGSKRDVSPILQYLRNFLLKRKNVNLLRFRDEISARTQPPPNLPNGPHQKLADNYYYTRDARRLVSQTQVLFENGDVPKLEAETVKALPIVERVPGKTHNWDG